MTISVLLTNDSEIMRKAIADLPQGDPEIQVLAEAASLSQAMQLIDKLRSQIVVIDLHMGDDRDVTSSQVKSCLVGSTLPAISLWNYDETKALADSYGAAVLLDKTKLAYELIPAIKQYGKK
jgi:two-component system, NarL family, response regulator DevR